MQQAIALFVLKTDAGFSIFNWIATLASDFLLQANAGSGFFFDADTIAKHWFFVNTVCYVFAISRNLTMHIAWCYHIFYCIRANDVLSGCHAMDYQTLFLVFLQAHEYFRRGSRRSSVFSLGRHG